MKVGIVGFGSIGQRHARNFGLKGCEVALVTSSLQTVYPCFSDIRALIVNFRPDIVLICNRTADHLKTFDALGSSEFKGLLIVEKPVFHELQRRDQGSFRDVRVSYNFRFHTILRELKSIVGDQKVVSVHAYVGQHLPTWRPSVDYRTSYSAKSVEGGGVLLDLSHELDFIQWLFGDFSSLCAHGGKFSDLDIETEDTYSLIGITTRCPHVTITLNYTDRNKRRFLIVHTAEHSYEVDFIAARMVVDGETKSYVLEGNHSYFDMAEDILTNEAKQLTTLEEALKTLNVIKAAQHSNSTRAWEAL